jgi:hypothetical protein
LEEEDAVLSDMIENIWHNFTNYIPYIKEVFSLVDHPNNILERCFVNEFIAVNIIKIYLVIKQLSEAVAKVTST